MAKVFTNQLTPREKDVVFAACKGLSCKMIADDLGIEGNTVRKHLCNVYRRFKLSGRVELVLKFAKK
jgi:DNA-binding NarL/FixJ family response regulator